MTDGAIGGQTSPRKSLLGPTESVWRVGRHDGALHAGEPWPVLPAMLTFQEVVSKSLRREGRCRRHGNPGERHRSLQAGRNGGAATRSCWSASPITLVVRRIFRAGKACIDRVIIKIIPENASRVAALLAGDVDIINELPAHDIRNVEANPNTKVMAVNGTRTFFVALNNTRKPFDDVRVRRAANHALNRQLIIDKLLNGRAVQLNGVMSPRRVRLQSRACRNTPTTSRRRRRCWPRPAIRTASTSRWTPTDRRRRWPRRSPRC